MNFFFMAFNLNKQPAIDILADLRGAYILGEMLQSIESGMIIIYYLRLLNIYQAHGMKIHRTAQML
jgi:hypothetical protein